jgi:hypothetical protein
LHTYRKDTQGDLDPSCAGEADRTIGESGGERLARDELGSDVVQVAVSAGVVDRHDVGVVELGSGLGLAEESLDVLGILQGPRQRDFEGYFPRQDWVEGAIDRPKRPGPESLADVEPTDLAGE